MTVEILLMTDVKDLGAQGDVVKVADGYARNFLIPRKLGEPVSEGTRRRLAKLQRERAEAEKAQLESFRAMAAELVKNSVTIRVKVGEENKLFGSVTNADIAEALKPLGFEIEKNKIQLDDPIKELGVYDVPVRLHAQVEVTLKVWVVEE
mgnify:CR=1 FL=1